MTSYIQPRHGNLTSIEPRAKVKKTYAQWKAYPHFKHCIEFPSEYNVVSCFDYYSVFKWCYEALGEGIDLRTWIVLKESGNWRSTQGQRSINKFENLPMR